MKSLLLLLMAVVFLLVVEMTAVDRLHLPLSDVCRSSPTPGATLPLLQAISFARRASGEVQRNQPAGNSTPAARPANDARRVGSDDVNILVLISFAAAAASCF